MLLTFSVYVDARRADLRLRQATQKAKLHVSDSVDGKGHWIGLLLGSKNFSQFSVSIELYLITKMLQTTVESKFI